MGDGSVNARVQKHGIGWWRYEGTAVCRAAECSRYARKVTRLRRARRRGVDDAGIGAGLLHAQQRRDTRERKGSDVNHGS